MVKIDITKPYNQLPKLKDLDIKNISYDKNLLEEARKQLHILEGATLAQEDLIHRLFDITVLEEALRSSEIEGIHTTPFEVFVYDLLQKQNDSSEEKVSNYKKAILDLLINKNDYTPITHRAFKALYNKILPKETGEFRSTNKKIVNHTTKETRFVPPGHELVSDFVTDLEKFINNKNIDILLRIPITHYQFECVHPFDDGNGRTGRLLILLQLLDEGILKYPIVHISRYINKDKPKYSDLLLRTTTEECWGELINYFSEGIISSVKSTLNIIIELKKHTKELEAKIREVLPNGSDPAMIANFLIDNPVTNIQKFCDSVNIARDTGKKYLETLSESKILIHKKIGVNSVYGDMQTLRILHS